MQGRRRSGVVLLLAASAIYYLGVVRVDLASTVAFDLHPGPDAHEYLATAVEFRRSGRLRIEVAGEQHPSRYPPAFPLAMQPALWAGAAPVEAPFRTNQAAGIILLGLLFFLLWRRGHPLAAGWAALLLATLPAFLILSRSPMSELTSAVLVVAAAGLLLDGAGGGSRARMLAGAALLGLGLAFRVANIFLALIPLLLAVGLEVSWRKRLRLILLIGAAYLAGALPFLAYNLSAFGSFLTTGYHYWVPYWADASTAYQLQHLPEQLSYFWRELINREVRPTTASAYGLGSYFGPAFMLLVIPAAVRLVGGPKARPLLIVATVIVAQQLLYFFPDGRLLFLPMVGGVVAVALMLEQLSERRLSVQISITVLVAAHLLVFPGRFRAFDLFRYLDWARHHSPTAYYAPLQRLNERAFQGERLILTDTSPPYVSALAAGRPIVIPLQPDHDYRFNPAVFQFDERRARRHIRQVLGRGGEVWALVGRDRRLMLPQLIDRAPPGWEWVSEEPPAAEAALLRLVRRGSSAADLP